MEKTNNLAIPIAIVIAGLLIAGGIYFSNDKPSFKNNKIDNKKNIKEQKIDVAPVTSKDHILGNPKAKAVLIEFSDTECPFCKKFHTTMNEMVDKYGKSGDFAWVYRQFPLDQLHKKARKEAEATECATELGGNVAFWDFINRLFEITPSNDGLDLQKLPEIAQYVGLDKDEFAECLSSGRQAQNVQSQYQDGVRAGAKGTPYSILILNGKDKVVVSGAMPSIIMDVIIGMAVNDKNADDINGFIRLVRSGASDESIENFLQEKYPEKNNE